MVPRPGCALTPRLHSTGVSRMQRRSTVAVARTGRQRLTPSSPKQVKKLLQVDYSGERRGTSAADSSCSEEGAMPSIPRAAAAGTAALLLLSSSLGSPALAATALPAILGPVVEAPESTSKAQRGGEGDSGTSTQHVLQLSSSPFFYPSAAAAPGTEDGTADPKERYFFFSPRGDARISPVAASTAAATAAANPGEAAAADAGDEYPEGTEWRYSDFESLVQKGKIAAVRISPDGSQLICVSTASSQCAPAATRGRDHSCPVQIVGCVLFLQLITSSLMSFLLLTSLCSPFCPPPLLLSLFYCSLRHRPPSAFPFPAAAAHHLHVCVLLNLPAASARVSSFPSHLPATPARPSSPPCARTTWRSSQGRRIPRAPRASSSSPECSLWGCGWCCQRRSRSESRSSS